MDRARLYATEIDDAYIALFTLRGDGTTVRVTDWDADVVSRGITYRAQAFAVTLPEASDASPPRARIRIDNASLMFVEAIRSVNEVLTATLAIVPVSDPDQVDLGPFDFECRVARYDGAVVEMDLTYEPILDMAVPHHLFTPGNFPGLFR
ncbi:hypothetical protein [uncultured Zoogloea sp.]|uniref:hypothetical protein n=1 Tax=uncultured Zoogloea sp. TaxID=160237 RepID=UPI002637A9F1|nr:hypothetical protein [uncultured Zoogloea sp.]